MKEEEGPITILPIEGMDAQRGAEPKSSRAPKAIHTVVPANNAEAGQTTNVASGDKSTRIAKLHETRIPAQKQHMMVMVWHGCLLCLRLHQNQVFAGGLKTDKRFLARKDCALAQEKRWIKVDLIHATFGQQHAAEAWQAQHHRPAVEDVVQSAKPNHVGLKIRLIIDLSHRRQPD
eukprot:5774139-Amphidinium_carterae.2